MQTIDRGRLLGGQPWESRASATASSALVRGRAPLFRESGVVELGADHRQCLVVHVHDPGHVYAGLCAERLPARENPRAAVASPRDGEGTGKPADDDAEPDGVLASVRSVAPACDRTMVLRNDPRTQVRF